MKFCGKRSQYFAFPNLIWGRMRVMFSNILPSPCFSLFHRSCVDSKRASLSLMRNPHWGWCFSFVGRALLSDLYFLWSDLYFLAVTSIFLLLKKPHSQIYISSKSDLNFHGQIYISFCWESLRVRFIGAQVRDGFRFADAVFLPSPPSPPPPRLTKYFLCFLLRNTQSWDLASLKGWTSAAVQKQISTANIFN